jgi:adenylate cyclase
MSALTAADLARQAGTTPEQIDRLAGLGVLEAKDDGLFRQVDVHKVRLAQAMLAAGVSLDDMARLVAERKYTFDYIEQVFPQAPPPVLDETYADVSAEAGLPMDLVQQLYINWSLPPPAADQRIRADDAEIIRGRGALIREFGLDHEVLLAASRIIGENIRKMAESQVRFFRDRVIERLRATGMSWSEVLDVIGPVAAGMRNRADQLRALIYDRHLEDYIFQEAVEMFEAAMEEAGYGRPRPVHPPAIAFLDMGGYTLLTQEAGDEAAAELAERLVGLVRRAARDHGGEPVKLLGDGVMFHFPRAVEAIACGLELVEAAERKGLPPARVGADAGPVVFRDGDYFGQTVNLAARITDYARPGEVLVSEAAVAECDGGGFEFDPIGEIPLKGVREPVSLYRALNRHNSAAS